MKFGCALPMGPFELLDVVGNDVSLAIQRELYLEFREPGFAPAPLLEHLVTAGYLGRKTGGASATTPRADRLSAEPGSTGRAARVPATDDLGPRGAIMLAVDVHTGRHRRRPPTAALEGEPARATRRARDPGPPRSTVRTPRRAGRAPGRPSRRTRTPGSPWRAARSGRRPRLARTPTTSWAERARRSSCRSADHRLP